MKRQVLYCLPLCQVSGLGGHKLLPSSLSSFGLSDEETSTVSLAEMAPNVSFSVSPTENIASILHS
jgi:hypothetical protein